MPTSLIIHGAYGSPEENWIPWLRKKLEAHGHTVLVPSFPTPEEQDVHTWLSIMNTYYEQLDKDTVLIGHSIGATFLLSVLERLDQPVQKTVLVSGFVRSLHNETFDAINHTFYEKAFDWEKIRANAGEIHIFHGDNDPYVPLQEAEHLADQLHTSVSVIPQGGHLNEDAGYTTFESLYRCVSGSPLSPQPHAYSAPFLGQQVGVSIDRPLGAKHPKFDWIYPVNYGEVPGTIAPDGGGIDVYVLGINEPLKTFTGICIAVIHRINDNDDKLIVVPEDQKDQWSEGRINEATEFQEQYFESVIVIDKD